MENGFLARLHVRSGCHRHQLLQQVKQCWRRSGLDDKDTISVQIDSTMADKSNQPRGSSQDFTWLIYFLWSVLCFIYDETSSI
jgi:hypothetical protein